jgi:hypothetical protein
MNRIQTSCCLIAAAGMCLSASARQVQAVAQPERARPTVLLQEAGEPNDGVQSTERFSDRQVFDMPLPGPSHPPLGEIPAMPMPHPEEGGQSPIPVGRQWTDVSGGMTVYDASTGNWHEIPARVPSGLTGAQSAEGDYWGVVDHDPSDELQRNFGTMGLAGSLDSWPRSGNVKLAMRFTDQNGIQRWYSCSGTMGVVLTAAHCVYARSPNGIDIFDWADIIYVYPAWDGDGNIFPPASDDIFENFGYASGTTYLAGTNYINNGDFDADAGLVRITRGTSRNVGMLTGWFSWAWGFDCGTIQGRTYNNFSYPGEDCGSPGLHNGRDMYYWSGGFDECPGNQLQLNTTPGCFTAVWGGMSGSGAYYIDGDARHVHAVCSNSNRTTRGRYAKLWETFVNDMVDYENATRTNSEDWEPLMFRARASTTVQAGTAMSDSLDVKMINATNANPPVRDYVLRVYLSTNNLISSSDTLLNTWLWADRDFGAMANVNFAVPAPTIPIDTPPGQYWLGVIADSSLPGTTANNDSSGWDAQRITVTLGLPAAASGPSPANNSTGQAIGVNLDWANALRTTTYRVHFGTVNPPPFVGQTGASAWNLPQLNYDTRYYWRIDTVNSAGTTTGPVWNFRTDVEPRPDLSAEVADAPSGSFYRGSNINIFHRTRNIGNAASTGTTVQFRISTNNIISAGDTLMDTRNFAGLGVNSVLQTTSSVQIPPTLAPGAYFVGTMVSEPTNNEPSMSNNWIPDTNTITVLACGADLAAPWGVLNFFDLSAYLAAYNAHQPSADLAGPFGVFNFFDISAYLNLFNAGCP